MPRVPTLDNAALAELLAVASESAGYPLQKALRRASRRAFMWPVEASLLYGDGRSLTELAGVGPHLQRVIPGWFEEPPPLPHMPALPSGLLTIPAAHKLLVSAP